MSPSSCSVKSCGTSSDQTPAVSSLFCSISLTTAKVELFTGTTSAISVVNHSRHTVCILVTHTWQMRREMWFCTCDFVLTPSATKVEEHAERRCINSAVTGSDSFFCVSLCVQLSCIRFCPRTDILHIQQSFTPPTSTSYWESFTPSVGISESSVIWSDILTQINKWRFFF